MLISAILLINLLNLRIWQRMNRRESLVWRGSNTDVWDGIILRRGSKVLVVRIVCGGDCWSLLLGLIWNWIWIWIVDQNLLSICDWHLLLHRLLIVYLTKLLLLGLLWLILQVLLIWCRGLERGAQVLDPVCVIHRVEEIHVFVN